MKTKVDISKQFFDNKAQDVNTSFIRTVSLSQKNEFDLIRKNISEKPRESTILDIGGGWGRISLFFLKEGFSVTVVDVSIGALNTLNTIYTNEKNDAWGNLETIEGDLSKLGNIGTYDIVFCIAILHHADSIKNILDKAYKSLKRGGRLIVLEPNPMNLLWYIFIFYQRMWKVEKGILRCRRNSIIQYLKDSDFNSIKVEGYGMFPNCIFNFSEKLLKINASVIPNLSFLKEFALFNIYTGIK
ncbi:MAG: class I SAM-dependent methyltransferase [Candidatus Ancaeobacter aquaticus]|nr:class I SAM-dependent methyltransferase [Candidatus Ancaeobacter aquaticus]